MSEGVLVLKPWATMSAQERWQWGLAEGMPIGDRQWALIYEASRDMRIRWYIRRQAGLLAQREGKRQVGVGHVRRVLAALRAASPEQIDLIKSELNLAPTKEH